MTNKDLFDKLFRDKSGRIIIAQSPNWPICGFMLSYFSGWLLRDGLIATGLQLVGWFFLVYWAYLEITQGVNLFRRSIGGFVLIILIILVLTS